MKWKTIDSVPKDGTIVLLCNDQIMYVGIWRDLCGYLAGGWKLAFGCWCCNDNDREPTHWMPLPEKP